MDQNQQQLAEFVQWLPQNIAQFRGQIPDEVIVPIANAKTPEEVVGVLNQLSQSEQGNQLVAGIFQAYQQSKQQGMFKNGGKLYQLLTKFQDGGKTVTKERKDVNERTIYSSGPRGGQAIYTQLPDGTQKYTLTRNEQGFDSNTDGTYFPYEESTITITPQGDTTGVYSAYHANAVLPSKKYVTQASADNFKLNHPFWGLNKDKTRVIPEGWWKAFNSNFGLERK